jgi:hypothetical protein
MSSWSKYRPVSALWSTADLIRDNRSAKLRFQAPTAESTIFKNCTMYINGYAGDKEGNLELEHLVHLNGGKVVKAYSKTRITRWSLSVGGLVSNTEADVIATNGLSGTKLEKEIQARKNTTQLVHPDWCVRAPAFLAALICWQGPGVHQARPKTVRKRLSRRRIRGAFRV